MSDKNLWVSLGEEKNDMETLAMLVPNGMVISRSSRLCDVSEALTFVPGHKDELSVWIEENRQKES